MKKALLIAGFGFALAACGQAQETSAPKQAATVEAPAKMASKNVSEQRLAAVLVYADWCGSCKVLDPKLENVRSANEFEGTQFITLDYTDRSNETFFTAADNAGVGEAVRAYLGDSVKTGQLLLVDLDDGKVVGAIKKGMTEENIAKTINDAAAIA